MVHIHASKKHALGAWDKNDTWTAYTGRKDKQYLWLIKVKYRKPNEESGNKNWW